MHALKIVSFPSLILIVSILVAGCSAFSGYPKNYQDTSALIDADAPYLSADVRRKATASLDSERGGLSPQQYRDAVSYARIEVIDVNYYDFESHLVGSYDALSLGSDLTTLILNGLGATTGSAATKAALAAASAGVIGANAAGAVEKGWELHARSPDLLVREVGSCQSVMMAVASIST